MLAPLLRQFDLRSALAFFAALNVLLVGASVCLWWFVRWSLPKRRLFSNPRPLTRGDLVLTCSCIATNGVVSVVGWKLWQAGFLTLSNASIFGSLLDFIQMLVLMDLGMYLTHRIAHIPWIYGWLHRSHHDHIETNALSLFVLSPLEVLGFGGLLLIAILAIQPSELGLTLYLMTNLIVGTLGHTGVNFIATDSRWRRGLQPWDTSDFHALHHRQRDCNYGFYFPLWDMLFGTFGQRRRVAD